MLLDNIMKVEHGFKHIVEAGDTILANRAINHFEFTKELLPDKKYQFRMLATYILGRLSVDNQKALKILETKVALDDNWRVQEMLAKAFDYYCKIIGYENALPEIENWLSRMNPNNKRAVVEGLRVWTARPYFKENPAVAVRLIAQSKFDESEYLRKSVGNALRDVSKIHNELVEAEISCWDLRDKKLLYIYKLVQK